MKLEPDQQIAIIFVSTIICTCVAMAVTYLGPYLGTAITSLALTVIALIIGQIDNPNRW